jgi:hypothetical protein
MGRATAFGPNPAFVLRTEPLYGVSAVPASIGGMA